MLMSSRSPCQWPNCLETITKRCQAQTAAWADACPRHMTRRQPVCRYDTRLRHRANQIFNHSTIYSSHITWEMPVCDSPSCFHCAKCVQVLSSGLSHSFESWVAFNSPAFHSFYITDDY